MDPKEDLSEDVDTLTTDMDGEILQNEVAICEFLFDSIAVDPAERVVFTYSAVGEVLTMGK